MYQAPLKDLRFVLDELLGSGRAVRQLAALPGFFQRTGRIGARRGGALRAGRAGADQPRRRQHRRACATAPCRCRPNSAAPTSNLSRPAGRSLPRPTEHGGQGAPLVLAAAVEEIGFGANLRLHALSAAERAAPPRRSRRWRRRQLQALLLPKLISGEWTGTMNLTEPQAGSDLALIRTRADARWRPLSHHAARRSSSPTASTTWPTTSCTWCWRASTARRRASRAFRCSRCPSS